MSVVSAQHLENSANIIRLREDQIVAEGSLRPKPSPRSTTLVINASIEMAREITSELSTSLPHSNILFAPTLQLALWIVKRRPVDIILSSAILPDGTIAKLKENLAELEQSPELVVLGNSSVERDYFSKDSEYRFVELRRLGSELSEGSEDTISSLGADIRNDLNNPLQEIVAMAFVAANSSGLSSMAEDALTAIERAAKNMSQVVNKIEDKIRDVVGTASGGPLD